MLRLLHTRPAFQRSLEHLHRCRLPHDGSRRLKSSHRSRTHKDTPSDTNSVTKPDPKPPQPTWLAQKIQASPRAKWWFDRLTTILGLNSDKQVAGRRAFVLYENLCVGVADANQEFWQKECDLPPTFQSWFTVTNLHVWMLTVRLRALPDPHGKYYVQFLLDHFFLDIEDRIRAILQPSIPPATPYTPFSSFYVNPNIPKDGKLKRGSRAPERLVTRQMKIFREQWMGMGMSFDLGLVKSDAELAAAIWRNLMGARGARGITYPISDIPSPTFRRSVNLVGGSVVNPEKVDFEKEETTDDGSGVHDYPPDQVDKYVRYPELMLEIVTYIRRELVRLEGISDEDIMEGYISAAMKFGGLNRIKK
ncbi:Serine carboxypeptidase 3 [Marasmius crinis-equi]|uniref:Serine carboxypeptidase 3 n=1 Tax=Marasmius crinis-equi TaxID=585013 RepID=A0ABR3FNA8_9AGAR